MGRMEERVKAIQVGMVSLSERRVGTALCKMVPGESWRVVLVLDPLFSLVEW